MSCPAIISVSQRSDIAGKRAKAAPRVTPPRITNSPVLLTGLAKCGADGCASGLVIRTGKSGQYAYYTCNAKLTAGAGACASKAIRQEELDRIVVDALSRRILAPERLTQLLAHVLERSDLADTRRRADLARIRRERQAIEGRVRRLYESIEDGLVDRCDPILAERLAEHNRMLGQLGATERSLAAQLATGARHIERSTVERFGKLIVEQMERNPQFCRAYVRMLVGRVEVRDTTVTIEGSVAAMEAALTADHSKGHP